MANRKPDLGKMYHVGQRVNGRLYEPPVSVKQARARVIDAMRHLEGNVRIGLDVGYALEILDEVVEDYREMVLTGEVDIERNPKIEAQVQELAAEIAGLEAEAVILDAMHRLEDEGEL